MCELLNCTYFSDPSVAFQNRGALALEVARRTIMRGVPKLLKAVPAQFVDAF